MFSAQCSVFSVQCSVFSAQCSVFSAQCSVLSNSKVLAWEGEAPAEPNISQAPASRGSAVPFPRLGGRGSCRAEHLSRRSIPHFRRPLPSLGRARLLPSRTPLKPLHPAFPPAPSRNANPRLARGWPLLIQTEHSGVFHHLCDVCHDSRRTSFSPDFFHATPACSSTNNTMLRTTVNQNFAMKDDFDDL